MLTVSRVVSVFVAPARTICLKAVEEIPQCCPPRFAFRDKCPFRRVLLSDTSL